MNQYVTYFVMNVSNVYMTALDATKAFDNSNVAVMA